MPTGRKSAVPPSQLGLFAAAAKPAPSFELNPRQREAVEHVAGPMLVVAGAGTGKTTVLTQRVARLIREGHALPAEILAITYTDNAAAELKQRVAQELGSERSAGLQATTFHAFCYRILENCGRAFRVVEPQDLWIYLRRRLPELRLKYYTRAVRPAQFLDALLNFFDNCHDELKSAADYEKYVQELNAGKHPLPRVTSSKDAPNLTPAEVLARCREIARVFRQVEDMLAHDNLGTFAHMILGAMKALESDAGILRREQARARFLLIDEFQDCNIAQIELAQLLAGKEQNIFAVGDPDQAIYRFRGASSAAFEEFVARFPETRAVVLDRNQRSTSPILNCSGAVIARNPSVACPIGKRERFQRQPLSSDRERRVRAEGAPVAPEPVSLVLVGDVAEEAADIAEQVATILRSPAPPSGGRPRCAVLYRSHLHREDVVKELALRGVPFRVEGLDAIETCEVRDLLASLRVLPMPVDNAALLRVAALPVFGLSPEAVREALRAAGKQPRLAAVLAPIPGGKAVLQAVENVRAEAAAADWKATVVLAIVIKRFGISAGAPPVIAFRDFVQKWSEKPITATGKLEEFLDYMEYFPEAGGTLAFQQPPPTDPANTAALMTVHAAKGLEFDHVFVARANQNSFPANYREKLFEMPAAMRDPRCLAKSDSSELHREEERRLFYVAMTRARDSLTIYSKPGQGRNPKPGLFVREVMDGHVPPPGWRQRPPELRLAAQAVATGATSGLGAWLLIPPSTRVLAGSLSASAIERYETCPLKFKIQREWNIPGEISAALQFGSAVHSALRDYFDAIRFGRPRTPEQLLQVFESTLAELPFDDPHQLELYRKLGREQLTAFCEARDGAPAPQVLSTERTFQFSVSGTVVNGRVDRIDGIDGQRVVIVDYKTGSPKTPVDARRSLQLSIYALAARQLWNYIPERLVFYNLETAEEVEACRTEKELKEAEERISDVARRIAAGQFDPTPGFHCRSCSFRSICPATEERLYTAEQAAASPAWPANHPVK